MLIERLPLKSKQKVMLNTLGLCPATAARAW